MKLTLQYDQVDSPADDGAWEVISFNGRHTNFKHPDSIFPLAVGLRRKLKCGTAFILSFYEHSGCAWSLISEGMQCRFDTTQVAGILIYKDPVKCLPKGYEKRAEIARCFLNEYNEWCNGQIFYYRLEEETLCPTCGQLEGKEIDSCGGFIGFDWLVQNLKEEHPEIFQDKQLEVVGDAADFW